MTSSYLSYANGKPTLLALNIPKSRDKQVHKEGRRLLGKTSYNRLEHLSCCVCPPPGF